MFCKSLFVGFERNARSHLEGHYDCLANLLDFETLMLAHLKHSDIRSVEERANTTNIRKQKYDEKERGSTEKEGRRRSSY